MRERLRLYLVLLVTFLAVDAVWLGVVARRFYADHLGFLLADDPNWYAAGAFYLIYVAAIQVFVVQPGLRRGSLRATAARAAFFGLVTYATYDLTNQATVRDWPLVVTVVDLAWGTLLGTVVGTVGHLAGRRAR